MRIAAAFMLFLSLGAAEPEFTVLPAGFSWTANANYDKGRLEAARQFLSFEVAVTSSDPTKVVGLRGATCTTALSDQGESLVPTQERRSTNGIQSTRSNQRPVWRTRLELAPPTLGLTSFKTLSGKVTVSLSDGPAKQARFPKLKDWLDKPVLLGDATEPLIISRTNNRLELKGKAAVLDAITKVGHVDAQGKDKWSNSQGNRSQNGLVTSRYFADVPPEGTLILILASQIRDVEVPFTFQDVRLTDAAPATPAVLVPMTPVAPATP